MDLSRGLEWHRVTSVAHKSRLPGIADKPRGPELPQGVTRERLGEIAARLLLPGRRGRGLGRHPVPEPLCLTVTVERVP